MLIHLWTVSWCWMWKFTIIWGGCWRRRSWDERKLNNKNVWAVSVFYSDIIQSIFTFKSTLYDILVPQLLYANLLLYFFVFERFFFVLMNNLSVEIFSFVFIVIVHVSITKLYVWSILHKVFIWNLIDISGILLYSKNKKKGTSSFHCHCKFHY